MGVALVIGSSESFLLTRVDPGKVTVQPGEGVNLLCVVDSDYEFCKWVSPRDKYCDFEWKRASGNITTQDCQIADKVSFHGRYDDRECGIRINSASVEDTGTWRCEVEQYVFLGSRGSGAVRKSNIEVTVEASTTAAPTTSTSSAMVPSTRKPRTTATTTTGATTEKVTTKNREVPPPESSEAFSLPFLSQSLPPLASFTTGAGRSGFLLLIMPQLLTLPIRESPSILRATKTQISTNTFLQI